MAPFETVAPRKRVAKYGKASKRANTGAPHSSFASLLDAKPSDSHQISSSVPLMRPIKRLQSPIHYDELNARSGREDNKQTTKTGKPVASIPLIAKTSAHIQDSSLARKERIESRDVIFDLPSSDDEKGRLAPVSKAVKNRQPKNVSGVVENSKLPTRKRKRENIYSETKSAGENNGAPLHSSKTARRGDAASTPDFGTITPPASSNEDLHSRDNSSPESARSLSRGPAVESVAPARNPIPSHLESRGKLQPSRPHITSPKNRIQSNYTSSDDWALPTDIPETKPVKNLPRPAIINQTRRSPKTPDKKIKNSTWSPKSPGVTSASKRLTAVTTPSQSVLWDHIIPDSALQSPGQLRMNRLAISTQFKEPLRSSEPAEDPELSAPSGQKHDLSNGPNDDEHRLGLTPRRSLKSKDEMRDTSGVAAEDLVRDSPARSDRHDESGSSQRIPSATKPGLKMTYAHQRTYLSDTRLSSAAESDPLLDLDQPLLHHSIESKPKTRKLAGAASSNEDPFSLDENTVTGVKTIHELRRAGTAKRFADDMDGFIDDMIIRPGASPSRRRSAIMCIVEKLTKKDFRTKFLSHAYDRQLFRMTANEEDIVMLLCVALCILLLSEASTSNRSVIQLSKLSIVNSLCGTLDFNESIPSFVKQRRWNMSKASQAHLIGICGTISTSKAWDSHGGPLSPRSVGLKSLEVLMQKSREVRVESPLSCAGLDKMIGVLRDAIDEDPELSQGDQSDIQSSLFIIDTHLAQSRSTSIQDSQASDLTDVATAYIPTLLQLEESKHAKIHQLALRLTANITSHCGAKNKLLEGPRLSVSLAQIVLVKFDALFGSIGDQDRDSVIECLITSLASLLNLSEWSHSLKDQLETKLPTGEALLDSLVQVFAQKIETTSEAYSIEEAQSNVPFSYLAVLLGNLCGSNSICARVKAQLPHQSLRPLIDTISEFMRHHQAVESQIVESEDGKSHDEMSSKLEAMLQRLSRQQ